MDEQTLQLNDARDREAATREILRVINRSPGDYQSVFEAILENAARLCDAPLGYLLIREEDGFHFVADRGGTPEINEYYRSHPLPLDPQQSVTARTAVERRPIQVPDIADHPLSRTGQEHRRVGVETLGVRTQLTVPMIRGDECIGVILVFRQEVREFEASHVDLLCTFAEQAVIAIDNVRRFKALQTRTAELTKTLERQTATSEILRSISRSPSDYAPVFQTILDNAIRLCGAPFGMLFLLRDDHLHVVADAGSRPEFVAYLQSNPQPVKLPLAVLSRAARERVPTQRADQMDETYRSGDANRVASVDIGGVRTLLGVPMLKGDETVGVIALYRQEVKAFDDDDIELVSTFADQAVIAIENVRLFQALHERTADLTQTLERQTATSEILRSISRSPTDYAPVFDTILANATRLCGAPFGNLFLLRNNHLNLVANLGGHPDFIDYTRETLLPLDHPVALTSRAARERAPEQIADLRDEAQRSGDPRLIAGVELGGIRTLLAVPMLKGNETVGAMTLYRHEVREFDDDDIELVTTFADQAVIAIENVRLFQALQARTADLTKTLERQTATSEILRSISRSPTDYAPVFQTILENATHLCGAPFGVLFLLRDGHLHIVANLGGHPDFIDYLKRTPLPVARQSTASNAARDQVPVHNLDIADAVYRAGDPIRKFTVDVGGLRTLLAVPMLKGNETVGVLSLYRQEVKAFVDDDIELVSTFADQAVIAIENVRLFQTLETRTTELTKTLERQTATSEILRAISRSPTDYAPVFDTILENATRLCDAPLGNLFLLDEGQLRSVASMGGRPAWIEYLAQNTVPVDDRTVVGHAAMRGHAMQIDVQAQFEADAGSSPPGRIASVELENIATLLAVPMLRDQQVIGIIAAYRREVRPFDEPLVELLETFADQAVIAIENVRLFKTVETRSTELAQTVAELEALGEVAQSVGSSLDVDTVLNTIVERAVQLSGADVGAINELDESTGTLPPRAAPGLEEMLDLPAPRLGEGAVGRAAASRAPVQIPDITAPGAYTGQLMETLSRLKIRALLAVPMVQDDQVLGTLVVARRTPGDFPPETVRMLRALGTQSAIAIHNARLFREIEDKGRELEAANRHKSEFLANMSHELRTPLNAVIGFSEVLGERMFGELNDKQAEYVKDIHDSGRHLLSLINDILDLSKIEAGAMELDLGRFALAPALDNAMTLVRERAERRGIALQAHLEDDLGEMEGDERKLKQILLNLLSNAIKFTGEGGTVTLEAKQDDAQVHIAVRDTGVGISEEDLAVIFDEFRQVGTDYARKVEGTGLGLTLTRRFVEMHGGRITVSSEPGAGSLFAVVLPLRQTEQVA